MIKVAVIGKIRSGKDSFAKVFIDDGYAEGKFGTAIADVIKMLYPEEWAKGKPRKHYQHVGQSMRELDPDVWVNALFRQIDKYEKKYGDCARVIITDVRQANEVARLRKEGYTIVKIEASEKIRVGRMLAAGDTFSREDLEHETEQYADIVVPDILVTNEGTLEDLEKAAGAVKRQIEAKHMGNT